MPPEPLSHAQRALIEASRRATLATVDDLGQPRLVPICFVLDPTAPILYSPLDDKPKRTEDPLALARVRDILARPAVTVLTDRWDEDWSRLAWVRGIGTATLLAPSEPGHAAAIAALRDKYPPYASHDIAARPLIAIRIERVTSWEASGPIDG